MKSAANTFAIIMLQGCSSHGALLLCRYPCSSALNNPAAGQVSAAYRPTVTWYDGASGSWDAPSCLRTAIRVVINLEMRRKTERHGIYYAGVLQQLFRRLELCCRPCRYCCRSGAWFGHPPAIYTLYRKQSTVWFHGLNEAYTLPFYSANDFCCPIVQCSRETDIRQVRVADLARLDVLYDRDLRRQIHSATCMYGMSRKLGWTSKRYTKN